MCNFYMTYFNRVVVSCNKKKNVSRCIKGLFILNATEAGGRSERGSLCVLLFDVMCCVWGKMM